jgi:predicted dehydrogenase
VATVVCEKPLVLSEEEYTQVAAARSASGSRVISINNWVHSDLNRHVSDLLIQGAVGAVESIELRTGRPDCALGHGGWMPRWRTNRQYSGGGIILDHGWHQLYLLMGWMQEPLESISARMRTVDSRHYPVEDEALIDMAFLSGRGRIELSWTAPGRTNAGVIQGQRGTISVLDDRIVVEGSKGRKELPFRDRLTESSYHPGWFEAVFRDNVLNESRVEADRNFAEAGTLVGAIQAAYRSAKDSGAPCRPTFPRLEEAGVAWDENGERAHGSGGGGATA